MAQGIDMTTEIQTDVSVSKTSTDTINIGKRLKAKRLELEFDERHVATALKIPIDQVRALEANNFQFFRSVTFARGFLKSYCRLLGIDHSEMLHAFDGEREGAESTIKPVDKVNKQTHLGDPFVIFISVVIVAVLVFLVFWWPSQSNQTVAADDTNGEVSETVVVPETETIEPVLNESSEPVPISNVSSSNASTGTTLERNDFVEGNTVKDAKTSSNDGVVTGLSAETMAILEEAGVSPAEVVRAAAAIPIERIVPPKAPSYSNDVEIVFEEDCWTEVRDATGKILFSGVKSAGSKLALTGNAPYRVVLGYAKGVSSLKYKGEVFDFSSFTRKDLARFELK
jgi:cytoskeleton protein RodZ